MKQEKKTIKIIGNWYMTKRVYYIHNKLPFFWWALGLSTLLEKILKLNQEYEDSQTSSNTKNHNHQGKGIGNFSSLVSNPGDTNIISEENLK